MVIRSKSKLLCNTHSSFNVVLVEPEIPPNTGNIARLCASTSTKLHLVHPLGFKIDDKKLKRAGLDYWHLLDIEEHRSWNEFYLKYQENNFWFLSTRGEKNLWQADFSPGDFLVFGSETKGLSEEILNIKNYNDYMISIPMNGQSRSINLSTAVGIVLYEALRQVTIEKKLYEITPI